MKTIWDKKTGQPREVEAVDAREILANSPDLYTDVNPNPSDDPDGDGRPGGPQNVANVENEFRREPVGADVPGVEREGTVIRNPVTDQPKMAPSAEEVSRVTIPEDWKKLEIDERRALAAKLGGPSDAKARDTNAFIQGVVDHRAAVAEANKASD